MLASRLCGGAAVLAVAVACSSTPSSSSPAHPPAAHRPIAMVCASVAPISTGTSCLHDQDCRGVPGGSCNAATNKCVFTSQCTTDGDCATGACACVGGPYMNSEVVGNVCASLGNCKLDSDCGPAGYCSPSAAPDCPLYVVGYYCHTPNDECVDDSDCPETPSELKGPKKRYCAYTGAAFRCTWQTC